METLTRHNIIKFFTRNKRKKIIFPTKNFFWEQWNKTNFSQEPLFNNILSCILFAVDKLAYDKDGNVCETNLEYVKELLHDRNLQQNRWSKKKIFECININLINNDFFLFLCQEFYINIIICSEIGIKLYYLEEELDLCMPIIVLQSYTDDITKQLYYQLIYQDNKLITKDELNLFLNYSDKFIIGLDKNKVLKIKEYSLVKKDDDIVNIYNTRELDTIHSTDSEKSDEDLFNEFQEI